MNIPKIEASSQGIGYNSKRFKRTEKRKKNIGYQGFEKESQTKGSL